MDLEDLKNKMLEITTTVENKKEGENYNPKKNSVYEEKIKTTISAFFLLIKTQADPNLALSIAGDINKAKERCLEYLERDTTSQLFEKALGEHAKEIVEYISSQSEYEKELNEEQKRGNQNRTIIAIKKNELYEEKKSEPAKTAMANKIAEEAAELRRPLKLAMQAKGYSDEQISTTLHNFNSKCEKIIEENVKPQIGEAILEDFSSKHTLIEKLYGEYIKDDNTNERELNTEMRDPFRTRIAVPELQGGEAEKRANENMPKEPTKKDDREPLSVEDII